MMSGQKVRYVVALIAAATIASASSALADTKKKSFADLLTNSVGVSTGGSVSIAGASSRSNAATVSNSRAAALASGVRAETARGNLTLQQYRRIVYRQLVQNRNNLLSALRLYTQEFRSGRLSLALYQASRLNATLIFTGYRTGLLSEYSSGTPYFFTTPIGRGSGAIQPGPVAVNPVTPAIVPPLTAIR